MFRFLDLSIKKTDVYPEVLARLKAGEKLLDLGCCFGQEIRQLVHDGAPSENMYGSDLRKDFMDIGYDLFLDTNTLKSNFIASDVFDDDSELVKQLSGTINMIYTGSFFHLFGYEEQVKVAKRSLQLLKRQKDGLIIGRQVGNVESGVFTQAGYNAEVERFRHNEESWKKMWTEVSEATGIMVDVQVTLDSAWMSEGAEKILSRIRRELGAKRLRFVIRTL
jgi:phospholipid N-methyltransferase